MIRSCSRKSVGVSQLDIARALGVSQALVSQVLAGKNEASPKMTARILKMAREKRYRPNALVRGMQTGRTGTIGVIVPSDGFYSWIVKGLHDQLARAGYLIYLVWNDEHVAAPDSNRELEYLHRLMDRRVEGVILRPTHDDVTDMYFSEVMGRGIPLVVVDRELTRTKCDFAGTDDFEGGAMAARHLLELGHRRLGQVAGPSVVSTAKDRRLGFEREVAEFGQGATCSTIEAEGFQNTKSEIRRLLSLDPRPTGVFGPSDFAAREMYEVAAELGLKVPRDLSVVGFADLPFAEWLSPPLTTLRQDPLGIGEAAAGLLLSQCAKGVRGKQKKVKLKPGLVVRGSTAGPGLNV